MNDSHLLLVHHPKRNVQRPLEVDIHADDPRRVSSVSAYTTVASWTIVRAMSPKIVSALKRCSIYADQSVTFRCRGIVGEQAQPGDVPDV